MFLSILLLHLLEQIVLGDVADAVVLASDGVVRGILLYQVESTETQVLAGQGQCQTPLDEGWVGEGVLTLCHKHYLSRGETEETILGDATFGPVGFAGIDCAFRTDSYHYTSARKSFAAREHS